MRHPERFEEDGETTRKIRFFDSSKATLLGTFEPDAPTDEDSRQVRRFKLRTWAFIQLRNHDLIGKGMRPTLRAWAKTVRAKANA